jgi:hypothetical protein
VVTSRCTAGFAAGKAGQPGEERAATCRKVPVAVAWVAFSSVGQISRLCFRSAGPLANADYRPEAHEGGRHEQGRHWDPDLDSADLPTPACAGMEVWAAVTGTRGDDVLAAGLLPVLGWTGHMVIEARAWSARRLVVCRLNESEHQKREAEGRPPVADPLLLRCVAAEDPGFMHAPSPVEIAGAIAVRKKWPSAVTNLGGFSAFGALAAVLPPAEADRLDVAAGALVEGIGVVACDGDGQVRLVHHPGSAPRTGTRTWVHRLIEEIVYDALLRAGGPGGAVGLPVRSPSSSSSSRGSSSRPADRA